MKISDALNEKDLLRLAERTVKAGDVYEMTMTEANGIKPKEAIRRVINTLLCWALMLTALLMEV